MYKTFIFNENALNEIFSALVENDKKINNWIDELFLLLFEKEYKDLTSEHLRKFLEEVFWASTLTEERTLHLPSVSLTKPLSYTEEQLKIGKNYRLHFDNPRLFEAKSIAKLAMALENTKHHIGVWIGKSGNLEIWGFTEKSKFIAKAVESGQVILIKRGRDFQTKWKIMINYSTIAFIKNFDSIFPLERYNVFARLVSEIRNHRHGGTLLIVNGNSWKKSIESAIYFNPPCQGLTNFTDELIENKKKGAGNEYRYLRGEEHLKLLGRMTAPDGATIINEKFEIIAFAAKIKTNSRNKLTHIDILKPFENSQNEEDVELSNLDGTRHQSAAKFIFYQKNYSFAIVASQDGKVSIMSWDKEVEKVLVIEHAEYLFV